MTARERLHGKMNPLMSLQVMISIEALRTLIALERAIVVLLLLLLMVMMTMLMLQVSGSGSCRSVTMMW